MNCRIPDKTMAGKNGSTLWNYCSQEWTLALKVQRWKARVFSMGSRWEQNMPNQQHDLGASPILCFLQRLEARMHSNLQTNPNRSNRQPHATLLLIRSVWDARCACCSI